MQRFKGSYIESLSNEDRQHLLMSSIPMLQGFQSKAGNEGRIFYVSEDVIVKKYFSKLDRPEVLGGAFDKYCQECEEFYLKGYKIPRIYAWTMVSRPDHTGFDYYLLEERVQGRELFFSDIIKMYEKDYKDHMSQENFNDVVKKPENNPLLYEKILYSYIHDFIEMNEQIESMSDLEIERFLEDIYNMFVECNYAIPDVHARNVLFHQGKLNLIDMYLEYDKDVTKIMKVTPAENLMLARMIMLFKYNGDIKKFKTNDPNLSYINEEIDFNGVLCAEALKKFIRVGKKLGKFSAKKQWWNGLVARIENVLEKDQTNEIIELIEPEILL